MNDFLVKVADVLEVDAVMPETVFRQTEGWCSLKAFGLLVTLDQEYGKQISIDEFLALQTVADLARVAGVA